MAVKTVDSSPFATPYTAKKVRAMKRRGIPAGFNPETGAARPKWLDAAEKAEEERLQRRR